MQMFLRKETKFHNRIDTSAWRRPIDYRFRVNNYTSTHSNHPPSLPSAFLTQTQEKIASLKLEMWCVTCKLEVACPRFGSSGFHNRLPPGLIQPLRCPSVFCSFGWDSFFWMIVEMLMNWKMMICLEFDCFCICFDQQPNKFQWKNVSDELSS